MHTEKTKVTPMKNVFDEQTIKVMEYHKRNALTSLEALRAIVDKMPQRPYALSQQLGVAIIKTDRIELGGLNVNTTSECTGDGGEDVPTTQTGEHS